MFGCNVPALDLLSLFSSSIFGTSQKLELLKKDLFIYSWLAEILF